jgi:nucleotide-binding universal stress UspA family protein
MYRSILVPLDGSSFAEQALPLALSIARHAGTTIRLVRVHETVLGTYRESILMYDETFDRQTREDEHVYLETIVKRLADAAPVPVNSALLEGPIIADAIQDHAQSMGADLLVMTTHGRGPLARVWLGSVADTLVRQATIPILFVRPQEALSNVAQEPAIRHVLITLDGSELAEQILEPAIALGAATQAAYTLLRVVKQMTPTRHDPTGGRLSGLSGPQFKQLQMIDHQQWAEAQDYLERLAGSLQARSLTVQTRVVSHEQPATAILDDAQKNKVDLIALATQGRGGFKRLFLGSVADKVVRGTDTPILVYRPVDKSAPAKK